MLAIITSGLYVGLGFALWDNIKLHSIISGDSDLDLYRAETCCAGAAGLAAWTTKGVFLAGWPLIMGGSWMAGKVEDWYARWCRRGKT